MSIHAGRAVCYPIDPSVRSGRDIGPQPAPARRGQTRKHPGRTRQPATRPGRGAVRRPRRAPSRHAGVGASAASGGAPTVEQLRRVPRAQAGVGFEALAGRLPAMLESEPPPRLAESHLAKLVKGAVQRELGRVLGCTADDALPMLLDPVPISREIEDVAVQIGLARPLPAGVEQLLFLLNAEPTRRAIRRRRGFGENEWGQHLEARRWILPTAMNLLEAEAAHRGWSDVTTPTRSEEHTSELQSQSNLVCRLLL